MKKLRIAHVTLSMGIGGLEHCILNLLDTLDPLEFDTRVICLDEPGALYPILEQRGVPALCEHRQPGLDFPLIRRLVSYFRGNRVDILHTHNQAAHFYAGIAAFLARVPVRITTEHSRHHISREKRRIWEKRLLYRVTDQWVTVNEALREASIREDGLAPDRLSVVPNGIPLPHEFPDRVPNKGGKKALGLPPDAPVILMVARLNPVKNHEMLFKAVARGGNVLEEARVVLAGDGEERDRLMALADTLGIGDRVHFLGSRDDVDHLLSLADVSVLCSHSEGLPLSLLESAAAGVPILVTGPANGANFITHGVTGRVADHTVPGLAGELEKMLASPGALIPLAEKGFEKVKQAFSCDTMAENYGALYRSLALKKGVRI